MYNNIYNFNPYHDEYGRFCSGNYYQYINIQKSDLYKNLSSNIKQAIDFVYTNKPIKTISGKEFQKDGIPLTEKVTQYYLEKYPNGVNNHELGNVKLDKEGVKDSLAHGISSLKAAAYMAVPDVIEKGFIYNKQTNWKNRGYNTAVLIAPIKIGQDDYICEVVVETRTNRQGFYLHEVEITNKLADMFKTPTKGSIPTSSKLIITHHINNFNPDINESLYIPSWEREKMAEEYFKR